MVGVARFDGGGNPEAAALPRQAAARARGCGLRTQDEGLSTPWRTWPSSCRKGSRELGLHTAEGGICGDTRQGGHHLDGGQGAWAGCSHGPLQRPRLPAGRAIRWLDVVVVTIVGSGSRLL